MQIGKRDRLIDIEQATLTENAYGESTETWAALYEDVWASVNFKAGKEDYESDELVGFQNVLFTIRYHSGVTVKMRVKYDSVYYYITYIQEVGRKKDQVLYTEERDND